VTRRRARKPPRVEADARTRQMVEDLRRIGVARALDAVHEARILLLSVGPDPIAGQIERVLFAVSRATLRGHSSLTMIYNRATEALEAEGMESGPDDWPFTDVDAAYAMVKGAPGGRFLEWGDFERALLRHARRLVRGGVSLPHFAVWMARAMMVTPRPWPDVRAGADVDLEEAVERAMAGESGWRDAGGNIVAGTPRLVTMLTKAMRAVGIDAKTRQEPFEWLRKAMRRRLSDKRKDPKTR
jgi:hypothetical protein